MRTDPIIYFAAAAQHSWCDWLHGHNVLENFENNLGEDGGSLARYRDTYASMAADLGAYMVMSEERRNGRLSPEKKAERKTAAIAWAVQHSAFYAFTSHYDDIEGGAEGNLRNYEECKAAGIVRLMPVFHQGEPMDLLRQYIRETRHARDGQFLGLGFQRPIRDEAAWLDACFSEIPEGCWVHGFAMTDYLRWPFRSADSKTWLHEVLAMESESGQGKSALAYLTKSELLDLVVKKYQRQWKRDLWRGTFGVAAGRGEQIDLEDMIREVLDGQTI